jgi:hypothetical protein
MSLLIRILLLLALVTATSCSQTGEKNKSRRLIPQDKLVAVMTDLYIADGLLSFPPIRNLYSAKDSISNYIDIVNSHGYTKEQMDITLKYYFIENPKKLQKIYDQIIARLSEMQASFSTGTTEPVSSNLWNQKHKLSVPEDGAHNPFFFSIPVKDTGLYELSFNAIIYNDDKSLNPHTFVYFWRSSETADGIREPWDKIELIRDGTRHSYSVRKRLADTTFTHVSGWLFQCDAQPGSWVKHGAFASVSLVRIPYSPE